MKMDREFHIIVHLEGWRRWDMILAGMAVVVLLGIFDISIGLEVPLSMFYFLPVMLVS